MTSHYIYHLHYLWCHITSIIYSICDVTVYIQYTCIIFICMRLELGKKRTTAQITGPVSQRVQINLIFTDNIRILWLWLSRLGHLVLLLPELWIIWLSNLLILSVPDEVYSRNVSCAINVISMFSLCLSYNIKKSKSPKVQIVWKEQKEASIY